MSVAAQYNSLIAQQKKMLINLDSWLDQAVAYAGTRDRFDPETLVQTRLFPDQFALVRQVQSACDSAKFNAARLGQKEAPKHPDEETTLAELKERIASTVAFMDTFTEADFEDVVGRKLYLSFLQGGWVYAQEYMDQFGVPNFYFHLTTAYAILRSCGVPLGKKVYLGSLPIHPADKE